MGIDRPLHARLEHLLEATAQLPGQKRFTRRPAGLIEIRLIARDLGLPLIALEVPVITGRFDGLPIMAALAPYPQHQPLFAKYLLVGVEIYRDLGCALRLRLYHSQQWNLFEIGQVGRRNFEFDLNFLVRTWRHSVHRATSQNDR